MSDRTLTPRRHPRLFAARSSGLPTLSCAAAPAPPIHAADSPAPRCLRRIPLRPSSPALLPTAETCSRSGSSCYRDDAAAQVLHPARGFREAGEFDLGYFTYNRGDARGRHDLSGHGRGAAVAARVLFAPPPSIYIRPQPPLPRRRGRLRWCDSGDLRVHGWAKLAPGTAGGAHPRGVEEVFEHLKCTN